MLQQAYTETERRLFLLYFVDAANTIVGIFSQSAQAIFGGALSRRVSFICCIMNFVAQLRIVQFVTPIAPLFQEEGDADPEQL